MNHIKANVVALLGPYSRHDAQSLQTVDNLRSITIWPADMEPLEGYTIVGAGTVEITIAEPDVIVQGKVEALRAELAKDRAESQARQNALIRKISELEALTYSEAA